MNEENIPEEAIQLHQQARQHGGKGEYKQAITLLMKAHQLAPHWAYPVYDIAFTYLLQQDYVNALKYYEQTNLMEPKGFFTAKTAEWSLRKEQEGVFPEGIYLAYIQIEWMNTDEERVQTAKAIVKQFPNYAPAWKEIASKSDDQSERLEAITKGLSLLPDDETKGVLILNKALVFDMQGSTAKAKQILNELINSQETTFNNVKLAQFVLTAIEDRD